MEWLSGNGYQTITLKKVKEYLDQNTPFPEKTIVLTFDDGYERLYVNAFPILIEMGFSATVFLVSGRCGKTNNWDEKAYVSRNSSLLGWDQIREMDLQGIEFGSHSVTHPRLDILDLAGIEKEVGESKIQIEEELGHTVSAFAYPFGWYDERVKRIVKQHYEVACSTQIGLVKGTSDPFELERVETYYLQKKPFFKLIQSKYFSGYLAVRSVLHQARAKLTHPAWR